MRISDWSSDVCSSDLAKAIVPDYALGTHVAALGLTFSDPQAIPASFSEGAFIGEHGSFNRNPPAGYKVVFVPFRDGKPSGNPVDFLSDFVDKEGNARGRRIGRAAWRERGWQDV